MDRSAWLWAGVIVGGVLFLLLAVDQVAQGPVYRADFPIDAWMTQVNATGLPIHPVGDLMSRPGSLVVDVPFLLGASVLLVMWGRWDLGLWCLGSGTAIGVLNPLLKAFFQRPLPPFIVHRYPHGLAFPSGHTMGAAGTLGVVILLLTEGHIWRRDLDDAAAHRWRLKAVTGWVVVSVVTGVGRILSQNHWLSDVLSAWAISAALVCATLLLAERPRSRPRPLDDPSSASRKAWWTTFAVALAACGAVMADTWWKGPLSAHVIAFNEHMAAWQANGAPTVAWGLAFSRLGAADIDLFVVLMGTLACLVLGSPRRALALASTAVVGSLLVLRLQQAFLGHNVSIVLNDQVTVAGHMTAGYSHLFPSGHTFGAALDFGLALVLTAEAWIDTSVLAPEPAHRLRAWTVGFWGLTIVACGAGRLLLRVHWYTDVLAGASLGIALVALAVLATRSPWTRRA